MATIPVCEDWFRWYFIANTYHLQASWRGRRVFAYIWWLPFPFKWPVLEPSNLLRTERRPIAAYHVFDEAQIGRREGGTGEPATRRNSGYCRSDHYQDGALFPGRTSIYTGRALFFLSMEFILLTFILPRFSPFPSWVISEDGFCRHATRGFSFSSEKQSSITLRQQKMPERLLFIQRMANTPTANTRAPLQNVTKETRNYIYGEWSRSNKFLKSVCRA